MPVERTICRPVASLPPRLSLAGRSGLRWLDGDQGAPGAPGSAQQLVERMDWRSVSGQSTRWQATARLLRRAGFGASGPQIDAVAAQDWSVYLDTVLGLNPDLDPGAVATPRPTPVTPPTGGSSAAELKALEQELTLQMNDLTAWWLRRMVAVQEPIHEKLTLLWHNHFATSAEKVPFAVWMGGRIRRCAPSSSATSAPWPSRCSATPRCCIGLTASATTR